ncbi:hypothetical protein QFZ81_004000 [Paenibacillus sp. V4I9]|uniref:ABC-three component system middle component 1 n=1 Tax=Paenibacillus sp. V4I9 TaxID=3042308 RepID=UPI00278B8A20|nr:ABC-three component system middle component 1 [Paenibacillus sp. V4I9]MDQ0888912.1 hypothetical protein [Paenibacillus sp. V4I9]
MLSYTSTYERLISKKFQKKELEVLKNFGVTFFYNGSIGVILQYWDYILSVEELINECVQIRETLLESSFNIWNCYYILCTDEEKTIETVYAMERETSSFRKYVIRGEIDLKRIPFLDDTIISNPQNPLLPDPLDLSDKLVLDLYSFILRNNGENQKLKKEAIDEALKLVLTERG